MEYANRRELQGWNPEGHLTNAGEGLTEDAFPMLITASSHWRNRQSIPSVANGYNNILGNAGSRHDLVLRLTQDEITANGGSGVPGDTLNGDELTVKYDPDGVPMLGLMTGDAASTDGKWFQGAGASSLGDYDPFYLSSPNLTIPGAGSAWKGANFSAHFIMFISVYLPIGWAWSNISKVGFDHGGYNHINGNHGSYAFYLGDWNGDNSQMGVCDVHTSGTNKTRISCRIPQLDPVDFPSGRLTIALCISSSGNGDVWAKYALNEDVYDIIGGDLVNTAVGSNWTVMSPNAPATLNLGENCGAGFGIHMLGIRNYSNIISIAEFERVMFSMVKTGMLPYWWR
jgi:hypothetical protein